MVVRVKSLGCQRIERRQPMMEIAGPMDFGKPRKLPTQFPVGRRTLEDAAKQPLEVERSSTDKEHLSPASSNLLNALVSLIEIAGEAEVVARVDQVDQVMRYGRTLLGRRLRRADVHTAIQRHGIERHNLRVNALAKLQANLGLARGGCATGGTSSRRQRKVSRAHSVRAEIWRERFEPTMAELAVGTGYGKTLQQHAGPTVDVELRQQGLLVPQVHVKHVT